MGFTSNVIAATLTAAALSLPAAAQDAVVPDDFATINSAVANASDGDLDGTISILVRAGTYLENVRVRRDAIALTGEDVATTIIQGNGLRDTVTVRADGTRIEGFTVVASGAVDCIDLRQASGTVISGNQLTGGGSGVRGTRARSVEVSDNDISGTSQEGIKFDNSSGALIRGNSVHDNVGEGIDFATSTRMRVLSNDVTNNASNGIRDRDGSGNVYRRNLSSGNGDNGFDLENSSGDLLANNTASNNVSNGLRMKDTADNLITQNAFIDNGEWGVRRENWLDDDFDRSVAGVQDPAGDNDLSGNVNGELRED